jgi:hypothetical protein
LEEVEDHPLSDDLDPGAGAAGLDINAGPFGDDSDLLDSGEKGPDRQKKEASDYKDSPSGHRIVEAHYSQFKPEQRNGQAFAFVSDL